MEKLKLDNEILNMYLENKDNKDVISIINNKLNLNDKIYIKTVITEYKNFIKVDRN